MYKNSPRSCISVIIVYICLFLLLSLPISAASDSHSWYCIRNKEHLQPRADESMRFIEKYNCYFVDRKHSDGDREKVVYLTFDAGYENGNIAKILDILKEESTPGAFFILGNLIRKNPDLIARMLSEGHTVANHTMHHHDMSRVTDEKEFMKELSSLEKLYSDVTGQPMAKFYRPPEGRFSEENLKWLKRNGYKTVFWSIAYADWDNENQPSCDFAKRKILDYLHNGAIILLHPTSATNVTILRDLIQIIKSEGYRFGTLNELTA